MHENRRAAARGIVWSATRMAEQEPIIEHPNREKASSKATKAVVILLLLILLLWFGVQRWRSA